MCADIPGKLSRLVSDSLKLLMTGAGAAFKCELIRFVTSKASQTERRGFRGSAVQGIHRK